LSLLPLNLRDQCDCKLAGDNRCWTGFHRSVYQRALNQGEQQMMFNRRWRWTFKHCNTWSKQVCKSIK